MPRILAGFHLLQNSLARQSKALLLAPECGSFSAHRGMRLGRLIARFGLLRFHRLAFPPSGHAVIIVPGSRFPAGNRPPRKTNSAARFPKQFLKTYQDGKNIKSQRFYGYNASRFVRVRLLRGRRLRGVVSVYPSSVTRLHFDLPGRFTPSNVAGTTHPCSSHCHRHGDLSRFLRAVSPLSLVLTYRLPGMAQNRRLIARRRFRRGD